MSFSVISNALSSYCSSFSTYKLYKGTTFLVGNLGNIRRLVKSLTFVFDRLNEVYLFSEFPWYFPVPKADKTLRADVFFLKVSNKLQL